MSGPRRLPWLWADLAPFDDTVEVDDPVDLLDGPVSLVLDVDEPRIESEFDDRDG